MTPEEGQRSRKINNYHGRDPVWGRSITMCESGRSAMAGLLSAIGYNDISRLRIEPSCVFIKCIQESRMAPRAYWKGYLKLSLVSCPIALYPAASSSERVSFNRINKK